MLYGPITLWREFQSLIRYVRVSVSSPLSQYTVDSVFPDFPTWANLIGENLYLIGFLFAFLKYEGGWVSFFICLRLICISYSGNCFFISFVHFSTGLLAFPLMFWISLTVKERYLLWYELQILFSSTFVFWFSLFPSCPYSHL